MTKEALRKALEPVFDLARNNPLFTIHFDKSLLDKIEHLEKEEQSPLLKTTEVEK